MTKASEIVTQAYREINLKPIGKALTDPEAAEGLALLNAFLSSLFGFEIGEAVSPWPSPPSTTSPVPARFPLFPQSEDLPSDVWPYPPPNSHIILNLTADTRMYFPQSPHDGAQMKVTSIADIAATEVITFDGNGRLLVGGATVFGTQASQNGKRYFYREDRAEWIELATLLDADEGPLTEAYDTLLQIGTAIRLGARQGRTITAIQAQEFKRLLRRMKSQYRQPTPSPADPQPFAINRGISTRITS